MDNLHRQLNEIAEAINKLSKRISALEMGDAHFDQQVQNAILAGDFTLTVRDRKQLLVHDSYTIEPDATLIIEGTGELVIIP